jgi:hypothetical protein
MTHKLFIFPTPADAHCELISDVDGLYRAAVADTHPTGRAGQSFTLDDALHGNGASLRLTAPGYVDLSLRGIPDLDTGTPGLAAFLVDDFTLTPLASTPPTQPPVTPPTGSSPWDIIQAVYATGLHDLSTVFGCGLFTEACATALHDGHAKAWGHIRKSPGQHQFNGHAVDAVMLGIPRTGADAGIYDIITNSASPDAQPAFNYVGPADLALWYYPADPIR